MIKAIVLDSTPVGLLAHREGFRPAEECHLWVERHLVAKRTVIVPAIIAYEIRRELIRTNNAKSLARLDAFIRAVPDRYLLLTDEDLVRAAELWAKVRQKGRPTADRHALDIDVILAAQAKSLKLADNQYVIATSNLAHFKDLAPAQEWQKI